MINKARRLNNILENVIVNWQKQAKYETGLNFKATDIQKIIGEFLGNVNFEVGMRAIPKSQEKEITTRFKLKPIKEIKND